MPTLPSAGGEPQPQPEPERSPHHARDMAESFGLDPERYDRARPRYPDALIERIVRTAPGADLLDVGIGTGIAARQFRAAGCRVHGVEADERMAAWAGRKDGFGIDVARFEDWDPAGRTFDAVVAGQTWHWVDPVAGAARAAEVLRPGGLFAAFWNVDDRESEAAKAFAEVYRRLLPDSILARRPKAGDSGAYGAVTAKAADGLRERAGAFGEPREWRFAWERRYTRDEWLDQLRTSGVCPNLPPAVQSELLVAIGDAIDGLGGDFTMGYTTLAITAVRT